MKGIDLECPPDLRRAAEAALRATGVKDGHLSVQLVSSEHIRELNLRFRGRDQATDVLAFPVDETGLVAGPRELGDVVICTDHTHDLQETVVHGVLHLAGYDHETDMGEMIALQREVLDELR